MRVRVRVRVRVKVRVRVRVRVRGLRPHQARVTGWSVYGADRKSRLGGASLERCRHSL